MNYARTRAHVKFCTAKHCMIEYDKSKVEQPCWMLEHLLDMVEESAVHAAAEKLRLEACQYDSDSANVTEQAKDSFRRTAAVLVQAAEDIDPFHVVGGKLVRRKDGLPVKQLEGKENDAQPGVHPG